MVATESANNATVGGTLVPSLALGIPGDASSAVLLGALLIQGFFPGPALFEQQPDIVGMVFRAASYPLAPVVIGGALVYSRRGRREKEVLSDPL